VSGERLENRIRTFELLLQKFSNTAGWWLDKHLSDLQNWMEENMGALTKLVNVQGQSLCEWLEMHAQDLSAWLHVNFGDFRECQDTYTKDYDHELGTAILAHDECSERNVKQTDMWLDQHAHVALDEQLGEDLLNFYDVPEMSASSVSSSLEDCAHSHTQFLKDHVAMLGQLWDNCRATFSMLLEGHNAAEEASFQEYTWDFLNMGPRIEELGSAETMAQQVEPFSYMKWLEKHGGALEQWLQSIIEG
ncbi:UNVERIFIED_CONTAM: hypothetical protein K2H54_037030, partial [Gekko kuhli]